MKKKLLVDTFFFLNFQLFEHLSILFLILPKFYNWKNLTQKRKRNDLHEYTLDIELSKNDGRKGRTGKEFRYDRIWPRIL